MAENIRIEMILKPDELALLDMLQEAATVFAQIENDIGELDDFTRGINQATRVVMARGIRRVKFQNEIQSR